MLDPIEITPVEFVGGQGDYKIYRTVGSALIIPLDDNRDISDFSAINAMLKRAKLPPIASGYLKIDDQDSIVFIWPEYSHGRLSMAVIPVDPNASPRQWKIDYLKKMSDDPDIVESSDTLNILDIFKSSDNLRILNTADTVKVFRSELRFEYENSRRPIRYIDTIDNLQIVKVLGDLSSVDRARLKALLTNPDYYYDPHSDMSYLHIIMRFTSNGDALDLIYDPVVRNLSIDVNGRYRRTFSLKRDSGIDDILHLTGTYHVR
ncbi:MAG: hypothetical protein ABI876_15990 [Bacteroidota bacterium]